ncbi:Lrp/AsnC family transcriptional regulator [Streptomyces puniciscabiei]|uniref:Lrp/AsnC family transcriptional regulator n=1 Tax=Streptomyces puniciscabiei TaxID=164348 RepID=UPI0006EB80D9|nr:Lrp/AsnC family transcriptional regulator [Streptomyces puniciscabiei]
MVTHMFTEGGRWRIAALDPAQRAQLTGPPPARTPVDPGEITPFDRALITRIAHDGRAPYRALASDLGVSLNTAKRRTGQLTRRGLLRFRCDFAPSAAGPSRPPSGPESRPPISPRSATPSSACPRPATAPPSAALTTSW